jgi:thioredoxin 1
VRIVNTVTSNDKAIVNNNVIELNEANFHREVLKATLPVLVEFWAGWSEPCKALAPLLESVAEDQAVPVKVARVNVEHHEKLTEQYGVRAVPTLLIFNQGGVQDQIIGHTTGQAVRERLERLK